MKLYYSPEYVGSGHAFDTTRKAKWIADSLAADPIDGVEIVAPDPVSLKDLRRVHDPVYVNAVRFGEPRELAESQGFEWDAGLWPMVRATNGGVLAAARSALADGVSGSLSSGLHHAKYDRGDGYCTFNGLVIAAKALLAEGAVESVLILDFDAHCGGGTASLIADEPRIVQLDVSVSSFDAYDPDEADVANLHLWHVEDADLYLNTIERRALRIIDRSDPFDLVLYNAGMDPYEGCAIGGLDGVGAHALASRERLVFDFCRERDMPVAFVLAGGYIGSRLSQQALVNLHRLTIQEAAR